MKKKVYVSPRSEVVCLTSCLANSFGNDEGDIGFGAASIIIDPSFGQTKNKIFEEEDFEDSEYREYSDISDDWDCIWMY